MLIEHKITFDDKKFQKIIVKKEKMILLTFRDDKFKKLKLQNK